MCLTRLLIAILLLYSASAFAQKQGDTQNPPSTQEPLPSASAEPGMILLQQPTAEPKKSPLEEPIDALELDPKSMPFQVEAQNDPMALDLEGQSPGDTFCYSIRSYVVARDSKNSDSTHPVGYSTCRPASRYHVKKVAPERLSH